MLGSSHTRLHLRMHHNYVQQAEARRVTLSQDKIVVREPSELRREMVWKPHRPYWFVLSCPIDLLKCLEGAA